MSKNIYGGGSQTNVNGLKFEQETDLVHAFLEIPGYSISNYKLYYHDKYIGIIAQKRKMYEYILEPNGIYYNEYISSQLLPDESLYLPEQNKIFIIEKKFQRVHGSVDEKLQTCEFKRMQYSKLFAPLDIKVEYGYILSDWFKRDKYTDVLNYINDKGCFYFFNEIPFDFLQVPNV